MIPLSIFPDSEDIAGTDIVLTLLFILVYLIVKFHFTRYMFSIKKQLWNQQQQINVLLKIADKLGVQEDKEVTKIKLKNNELKDTFWKI